MVNPTPEKPKDSGLPAPPRNPNPPRVIVMTGWRRPHYFARVVQNLEKCRGITDYKVLAFLDGGYPRAQAEMAEVLAASSLHCKTVCHRHNLSVNRNTFIAFEAGFDSGADWVILIEDDILPTADFLVYMEQALDGFAEYSDICSVGGYHPTEPIAPSPDRPGAGILDLWRRHFAVPFLPARRATAVALWEWFNPWGVGLWRRSWEGYVRDGWWGRAASWDVNINLYSRGKRLSAFPMMSRTQNIGLEAGWSRLGEADYYAEQFTENLYQGPPVERFDIEAARDFLDKSPDPEKSEWTESRSVR